MGGPTGISESALKETVKTVQNIEVDLQGGRDDIYLRERGNDGGLIRQGTVGPQPFPQPARDFEQWRLVKKLRPIEEK